MSTDNQKTHYWIKPKGDLSNIVENLTAQKTTSTPFLSLFNGKESVDNVEYRFGLYTAIWRRQLDKIESILNNANNDLFENLKQFIEEPLNEKLSVGYIQLTSNTANNSRILKKFYNYVDHKLIVLNNKHCANIKSTLREIIGQLDPESDQLNYDLEVLEGVKETIVIVLEDTNLISNQVLNQLLKILTSYDLPIKVILGLSCDTVSSWINSNLVNELKILIEGYKFKSNDNKSLGYTILNNLFLAPDLTDENLLIDRKLSTIILNRFENSNNSIDSLISEIKLCYMIYFYQSPLSILIKKNEFSQLYVDGLRKLPSFKKHIEIELHNQQKDSVKNLLTSDSTVIDLFQSCKSRYKIFKLTIINAINVIYNLTPNPKEKFELYKLLINNKLLNSKYLNEAIKNSTNLKLDNCTEEIDGVRDEYLIRLNQDIHTMEVSEALQHYFDNEILITPMEIMVFNEIFTMNGGRINSASLFEENYENLMINLVRPNLRSTIESGLDSCEPYLRNNSIEPSLTYLFKIYKEAPISINLYDFFQAYRSTIPRVSDVDDKTWDKMVYAWFIQNCFELMQMGILQQKPKGDYLEKAIWKGI